jgi:ABC-type glycerol-3-phosphate transport system substrate-binding protein
VTSDIFFDGKLGMDLSRPVVLARYRRELPFKWAVGAMPVGPRQKTRMSVGTVGSAWVAPGNTPNKEEAWELMQHLASPDVARVLIEFTRINPARKAVLQD